VGAQTAIIPLLNGMRHLDVLDESFGKDRVLGGQCGIAVTLDEHRHVVQLTPVFQSLTFGERDGTMSKRVRDIAETFAAGNIGSQASENIMQEMWEKWVLLTTLASSTSLMRAPVGHILAAPGGRDFMLGVRDECSAVAKAADHAPRAPFLQRTLGMLTTEGSPLTASMYRDIKAAAPVEADHIVGDMIARGDAAKVPVPRLRTAYTHLKAYEKQRG
jgi:2-dehydropantoate 2-reductase